MNRFNDPQESDISELVQLFRDGGKEKKQDAALALGTIGTVECIDTIRLALANEDDYVRSYAMMGIGRGMAARKCASEFLSAVFPALTQLLDRHDQSVGGKAPLLLLSIDQERAIPVLYSPQYFTTKNRELHYILRAINRHQIRIPHDRLMPLLAELKDSADTYPRDYTYGEALVAYGIHADHATDEWLRSELHSSNGRVREGAATGLLALHGISKPFPFSHVCQLMEDKGFKKLTEPQKHVYAVSTYRGEVDNGGHSQYFFNSDGDYWKSALFGLRAIGAKATASALSRAVALFEPDDVPRNREQRIELLMPLRAKASKPFDEIDEQFYAAGKVEDLDVLLALYAIDNKADFVSDT